MDNKFRALRRLWAIDNLVKYRLEDYDKIYMEYGLCDEDENYFYAVVSGWVIEQMYYNYFGDIDDSSNEWTEIFDIMEKYINSVHKKTIMDFFTDRCGKN